MRDRLIRYALALLLVLAISSSHPRLLPVLAPNPPGRWEQVNEVRILYLQGDPYEMGLQQGVLLRDQIREFVRDYLYKYILIEGGNSSLWLLYYVRQLERELPTDLCHEMRGIADGAGISYQDVLLLNIVPDLLALTHRSPSWGLSPMRFYSLNRSDVAPQSLCATFAAWGHATVDGELIVGYRLDSTKTDLPSRYRIMIVRQPSHGNAFVSLGSVGMVGVWAGMNEEKIAVTLSSSSSVDIALNGPPLPFVLRQVLEGAGDLSEAVNIILAAQRLYGGNVILGDGKGPKAIAIELSAHRHTIFEANAMDSSLARTNHFLDPELALAQQDILSAQDKTASEARLDRLQTLLKLNSGWIGVDKGLAFLKDDYDVKGSYEQESEPKAHEPYTSRSALLCPGKLTMWVARDNAIASFDQYIKLDFNALLLGQH